MINTLHLKKKSTVDPALRAFDKRDTPRKANPAKGNNPQANKGNNGGNRPNNPGQNKGNNRTNNPQGNTNANS